MSRFTIYTGVGIVMLIVGWNTLGIIALLLALITYLLNKAVQSTPQLKIIEKTLKDGSLHYEAHIKKGFLHPWYIEREGCTLRWVEVAGYQELDRLIRAKTIADDRTVISEKIIKQQKGDQ